MGFFFFVYSYTHTRTHTHSNRHPARVSTGLSLSRALPMSNNTEGSAVEQVIADVVNMRIAALSSRFYDAMTVFSLIAAIFLLVLGCLIYCINLVKLASHCHDGCLCKRLRNRHWYGSREQVVEGQKTDVPDAEGTAQTLLSLFVAFSLRSVVVIGMRAGTNGHCGEKCAFGIEIAVSLFVALGVWALFKFTKWGASILCLMVFVVFTAMAWQDTTIRWPAIALIAVIGVTGYAARRSFYQWLMETLCVVVSCLVIVYVSSYLHQTDTSEFDTFRRDVFGDESKESARRRTLDMIVFASLLAFNQLCWIIATCYSVFGENGCCHGVTVAARTAQADAEELRSTQQHLIPPEDPNAVGSSDDDDEDDENIGEYDTRTRTRTHTIDIPTKPQPPDARRKGEEA